MFIESGLLETVAEIQLYDFCIQRWDQPILEVNIIYWQQVRDCGFIHKFMLSSFTQKYLINILRRNVLECMMWLSGS